ncbi:Fe-S cluster assembly ATPase SufC [Acholeplasma laidlawii]|jgi:Fe-S cluster assembly ATP-binding protein|uniref:SUF system FeS cluster assembly protein n=2 Tax=Acholeplasma laidlawii TaxID=2148 RepID=A9NHI6_ACHLI|nr:Fe-S cluster assembly ATPase SufC [Acholeplasma laidlawii]ABX81816.1 SUF system FeS cluster assembly protein [Acholeplasma laidlawii PG-8A]NWH10803.1 Fe-S cluster assembly ATPase SufC [Acholeplasma laidlawii]NWH12188.1 Fe-S cluster assembly ATPase SufC [Acholeplasma laidlawii]NWH13574.1 Fe-S cluster assembly ATPase SufC [Acholeplasma laidlawii]OAN20137.1 ABC transporter ATP-binding protein [Acholeplasma laidlawii]
MSTLTINDLHVSIEDKEILKGVNLTVKTGEVHAIMGPNGTGKSTLASALMGHPKYEVTQGSALLDDADLLELEVDERARAGLFLAMQYPQEVSGVTNSDFMRQALKAVSGKDVPLIKFIMDYERYASELKMREDLPHRYLNEGFSGGERKRNEILQLKTLKPKFAILDEIDSGLDIDALRIVGENVNDMVSPDFGCILITHYQRILDYIKPTHVHIMINGKIVLSGGSDLIEKIDQSGYEWVKEELGIDFEVGKE